MSAEAGEPDPRTPSAPRRAAAVIVLREGARGPEVLLVRRSPHARFMADTWVFPGGALEAEVADARGDAELDRAHRAAAVRELREEAGITLAGAESELVEFAHWITPAQLSIRFDARFYLIRAPRDCEASVDGEECVEARWLAPSRALSAASARELQLAFPTLKQLEQLSTFSTVDELLEHARERSVAPVEPRLLLREGSAEIVLPGEPGFESLDDRADRFPA